MSDEMIGHNGGPGLVEESPWGRDGYVKVARAMRDHPIVGFGKTVSPAEPERGFCYSRAEAWQDLIMECRYQPGEVLNKGRRMELKPGQLLGAISWLAHRWNWTPKTVRWFLDQVQADHMISRSDPEQAGLLTENKDSPDSVRGVSESGMQKGKPKGNRVGVISICNYEIYQLAMSAQRQATGQAEGQASGKRTASERQAKGTTLIKEEGKKREEEGVKQLDSELDAARSRAAEAAAPVIDPTKPFSIDGAALAKRLMSVCGPALDDPVNCWGLASGAVPIMWLREGCDLELDVVETLRAMGVKHKGRKIRTWDYFTGAVYDARDRRLATRRPTPRTTPPPLDRQRHWIENTEAGRAKAREVGRDGAERYFAQHLAHEKLTPDGYTIEEINRRDEEGYAKLRQEWCRAAS